MVCLTNQSRVVIWPLEIYLSCRSEDAPWLSAVGCVRLVHAGGFLIPGCHPSSSTHLKHFLDSSPQRHTQEPPVAASRWAALKTEVSWHAAANLKKKGTGEDTKPWYLKCFKKKKVVKWSGSSHLSWFVLHNSQYMFKIVILLYLIVVWTASLSMVLSEDG